MIRIGNIKLGDKVSNFRIQKRGHEVALKIKKIGTVVGIYRRFVVVEFEGKKNITGEVAYYKECFFYNELDKVEEEEKNEFI